MICEKFNMFSNWNSSEYLNSFKSQLNAAATTIHSQASVAAQSYLAAKPGDPEQESGEPEKQVTPTKKEIQRS